MDSIRKYLPCPEFIQQWTKKFLSLIVSVKMIIIHQAFILCFLGKLKSENFAQVVIAVAAAKVGEMSVNFYKNRNKDEITQE